MRDVTSCFTPDKPIKLFKSKEEAENYLNEYLEKYNKEHNIVPKTIVKDIQEIISNEVVSETHENVKMSKKERMDMYLRIEEEMKLAAKNLDFERAMELRDILFELKAND